MLSLSGRKRFNPLQTIIANHQHPWLCGLYIISYWGHLTEEKMYKIFIHFKNITNINSIVYWKTRDERRLNLILYQMEYLYDDHPYCYLHYFYHFIQDYCKSFLKNEKSRAYAWCILKGIDGKKKNQTNYWEIIQIIDWPTIQKNDSSHLK